MATNVDSRAVENAVEGDIYPGSCFCGAVQFTVSGEPAAMGYCHCESCRHWSAGPVNAFTLWKTDAVRVTRTVSVFHRLNALTGPADQLRHDSQWQ